ncbi:MAG: hypothetical protein ACREO0_03350 [Pseudoxanthomonas sp.]
MKGKWVAMLCVLLAAPHVYACGMTNRLTPFALDAGSAGGETTSSEIPAPTVAVKEIVRGIGPKHASCDDTGLLSVALEWPRGKYKLRDIGFEFTVVSGTPPYAIFPEGPIQAPVEGRNSDFLFMWQEGAPAQQKTIDLQIDVRAVTRDNQRGPPTRIVVRAAPGGSS